MSRYGKLHAGKLNAGPLVELVEENRAAPLEQRP
jgi:hypothetical protein